jgi:hypothetical protein
MPNNHHQNMIEYSFIGNIDPADEYDAILKKLDEHPIYTNNFGKYIWVPYNLLKYLQKARDDEENFNSSKNGSDENEKDEILQPNHHKLHEQAKHSHESHQQGNDNHGSHENSEVLISLTKLAHLVYNLLHSHAHQHHLHKLCNFDLIKNIRPNDCYDTIYDKLKDHTTDADGNPIYTFNNEDYLWVPYNFLKCIQTAHNADHKPQSKTKLTTEPVSASKILPNNWRHNCKKYAKAYENLKNAEKAFYRVKHGKSSESSESNEHKKHSLKKKAALQHNHKSLEDFHNDQSSGDKNMIVVAKKIGK